MKHLINITDLSCEKIETLLQLAQDMKMRRSNIRKPARTKF